MPLARTMQHRRIGNVVAGRGHELGIAQHRGPVGIELGADARGEPGSEILDVVGGAHVLDGLERIERIGKAFDALPLLDGRTVDLLDLPNEELHEILALERDRELVDRDVLAALEHVDTDDVGTDRADARRDEAECPGTVGKPHPHDEPDDI